MDRRSLLLRVLTAVVGLPLFAGAAWLGGLWWAAVITILATIAALEFSRLVPAIGPTIFVPGVLVLIVALGFLFSDVVVIWVSFAAFVVLCATGIVPPVLAGHPGRAGWLAQSGSGMIVGWAYLGVSAGVLVHWGFEVGFPILLWFFVVFWVNDIAAFFVGHAVGRHKLAPRISPGKSWEGAIAGLVAGAALSWGLAGLLGLTPWQAAIAGGLVTMTAQLGDLFESAIKRRSGVKDSGMTFPGHGGVLDRFDGAFAAAPVAYLLLHWWAR